MRGSAAQGGAGQTGGLTHGVPPPPRRTSIHHVHEDLLHVGELLLSPLPLKVLHVTLLLVNAWTEDTPHC